MALLPCGPDSAAVFPSNDRGAKFFIGHIGSKGRAGFCPLRSLAQTWTIEKIWPLHHEEKSVGGKVY